METGADGKIVEATEKASPEASVSTIVDERAAAGAGTTPDTADRIGGIAAAAKEEEEEEGEGLVLEQPLLTIKEVFVYRVPPLRAASGHRAEEWGLANPVFTGEEVSRSAYPLFQASLLVPSLTFVPRPTFVPSPQFYSRTIVPLYLLIGKYDTFQHDMPTSHQYLEVYWPLCRRTLGSERHRYAIA